MYNVSIHTSPEWEGWGERPYPWAEQRKCGPHTVTWSSSLAASEKKKKDTIWQQNLSSQSELPPIKTLDSLVTVKVTVIKMNLLSSELMILYIQQNSCILCGITVAMLMTVKATPITSRKLNFQNVFSKMFYFRIA